MGCPTTGLAVVLSMLVEVDMSTNGRRGTDGPPAADDTAGVPTSTARAATTATAMALERWCRCLIGSLLLLVLTSVVAELWG
jgi:hypothetical protein